RENRLRVAFDDLPVPEFTGRGLVEPDLATLREYIDWQFFFHAWELKGKFPAILEQPAARELFDDAKRLLGRIVDERLLVARRAWYETGPKLPTEQLIAERFRGIRPAFGYPACPDHSEKPKLFALLGAEETGLALTETFAMTPAASVSGIYLAHPDARYFSVGRIGRDQVEDYAARKGISL